MIKAADCQRVTQGHLTWHALLLRENKTLFLSLVAKSSPNTHIMYVHRVYAKMYVCVYTHLFTSAPVASHLLTGAELIWEADIDIVQIFCIGGSH